jgi:hypothetical protein
VVLRRHCRGVGDLHHFAFVEEHGAVAEALHDLHVVSHQENGPAIGLEALEPIQALALE